MSLILDALRKLDREKSFRRERGVNIAREVVRPDIPARETRVGFYGLAILLTAVVSAAITYGLISKTLPPAAIESPGSGGVRSAPPDQEMLHEARKEAARPMGAPHEPVEAKRPAQIKKSPEIKKPFESKELTAKAKPPASSLHEEKPASQVVSEGETPSIEMRRSPQPVPERPALAPESLRLSGIVWSEEPTNRLAVINGMVTREGHVFEGVKVVEIYPDRVLLSVEGRSIELPLGK